MDVIVPVKRGDSQADLRVRTVARPEKRVSELLMRLGLELPARNKILRDAALPESHPRGPEGEM